MKDVWASDGEVSKPEPLDPAMPARVRFGGFAFTAAGMAFDLDAGEVEEIFTPTFAPEGYRQDG